MKKLFSVLLCFAIAAGVFASPCTACAETPEKPLSVVTTIFPEYDWVMNILGSAAGDADVVMLLDNGVDLHSYQPSVDDIIRLSTCDLFLYVGGESDSWVQDALKEAVNPDMVVLNLMELLGDAVREEELVEGMEAEEEEDGEDGDEDDGPEYDEHVWLSLKNAAVLCQAIADALCEIDGENAALYTENAAQYIQKLNDLDARYRAVTDAAPIKTLLFGDRFPFRYLTEDYGLAYYAAFVGCSAETEASFETVIFLANKLDELALPAVLQIETSDGSIPRTILQSAQNRDAEILTLDSMQSVTAKDVFAGASYLGIMEENLSVLERALQERQAG